MVRSQEADAGARHPDTPWGAGEYPRRGVHGDAGKPSMIFSKHVITAGPVMSNKRKE
jgi:hypothetical protein